MLKMQEIKTTKLHLNLSGDVYLDNNKLQNWTHVPLEFDEQMIATLQSSDQWTEYEELTIPAAYRAKFTIQGPPTDTFFEIGDWKKGILIVNGFNVGRYWDIGPQQTLYVPYPLLRQGENEVILFEVFQPSNQVTFTDKPCLEWFC